MFIGKAFFYSSFAVCVSSKSTQVDCLTSTFVLRLFVTSAILSLLSIFQEQIRFYYWMHVRPLHFLIDFGS